MLSHHCPVCLSVTLVYFGQTVGWIKMKLGMEAVLGPGHIVLDGNPAPPKGHSPSIFGHVCCGQTAAWIKMPLGTEIGLGPGDIPLDGDPAPPLKEAGAQQPPTFRPTYCGQTAGWIKVPFGMEVGLPQANCVRWTQLPLPKKGGGTAAPNFRPMHVVTKRLDGSRCHLVRMLASALATLC